MPKLCQFNCSTFTYENTVTNTNVCLSLLFLTITHFTVYTEKTHCSCGCHSQCFTWSSRGHNPHQQSEVGLHLGSASKLQYEMLKFEKQTRNQNFYHVLSLPSHGDFTFESELNDFFFCLLFSRSNHCEELFHSSF